MLKSFGPTNIPSMPGTFNMFSKLFTASTLSIPIIAMLFLLRDLEPQNPNLAEP